MKLARKAAFRDRPRATPIPARFVLYPARSANAVSRAGRRLWPTGPRPPRGSGNRIALLSKAARSPTYRGDSLPDANPLSGVKVMVIDDSNTIRRSAEIFLLQAGCTVILAEDGFDALAKIADHQPDLVFVDIMMPRLDGYQTCALIKKNAKFHHTPVIMLSSKDGLFDRARGRMVGSDQYLTKPFTKESLLKAVAAHVKAAA
jgi:twitching motility two-component system response regulator PilG